MHLQSRPNTNISKHTFKNYLKSGSCLFILCHLVHYFEANFKYFFSTSILITNKYIFKIRAEFWLSWLVNRGIDNIRIENQYVGQIYVFYKIKH